MKINLQWGEVVIEFLKGNPFATNFFKSIFCADSKYVHAFGQKHLLISGSEQYLEALQLPKWEHKINIYDLRGQMKEYKK